MITSEERTLQILTITVACGLAFIIGWLTYPTPPKVVQIMTTEYVETAPVQVPSVPLGATTQTPPGIIAFFETTLASNISSAATSFTLTSATDKEGTALASSTYAFIIDEGSANEEIVIADCTSTACTNASRGISVKTGTTTVATLQKSHRRGASVKITDAPYLPQLINMVNGAQVIPAIMRYTATAACSVGSNDSDICDKAYIDGVAVAGASNGNETTKGIYEAATAIEQASTTSTGSTGARLALTSSYATSSPRTGCSGSTRGALCIPVAQNDGTIHPFFIATSTTYTYNWDAIHNFSTTTTFNSAVKTTECTLTDGATITLNANNCVQARVVLGGNRTLTITNESVGQALRLVACSDSSARSITTFDSNILWPGGTTTPPTATATANRCDIYSFVTSAATGTTLIFGSIVPF